MVNAVQFGSQLMFSSKSSVTKKVVQFEERPCHRLIIRYVAETDFFFQKYDIHTSL